MNTPSNPSIVVPNPEPPPGWMCNHPSVAGPSQPGPKEHWDMIRGAIVHEDNLINHRLTWLLTAHAFLFAAFAAVQNVVMTRELSWMQVVMLEGLLIVLFGYLMLHCHTVSFAVTLAHEHLAHLRAWWMRVYPREARQPVSHPPRAPAAKGRWLENVTIQNVLYWLDRIPILNLPRLLYCLVIQYRWHRPPVFNYVIGPVRAGLPEDQCEPHQTNPTSFPPIGGCFNLDSFSSTKAIPWLLLQIDIVLLISSVLILYMNYFRPPHLSVIVVP